MIVVDTNILFSFFWKDSFTRKLLLNPNLKFISSVFAISELKKYDQLIMEKTGLINVEFKKYLSELKSVVTFVGKEKYSYFLKQAKIISPDEKDSEFLALCLKFSIPLWSNDKELKKQDKVNVLSTEDIVESVFG